jgi:hypothetical protein
MMVVLFQALHALHKYATDALPELPLAPAIPTMRVLGLSSSVALAALAATSRAAAPSVGAYIAAEAPVAAQNMFANIGSSGSRAPGAFVRVPDALASPASCLCCPF